MEIEEKPRITLKDIAEHTGLSKATVSRVINNMPNVSSKNRRAVRMVARSLGYRPDPALSALAKHRWSTHSPRFRNISIGLLEVHRGSDADGSSGETSVASHLVKSAEKLELVFDVFDVNNSTATDNLGRVLYNRGFDGFVAHVRRPMIDWSFPWKNFVTVTVGYDHPAHRNHSICSDWAGALELAYLKALDKGIERPGITVFRHQHPAMDREIEGAARTILARHYGSAKQIPIFFYSESSIKASAGAFADPVRLGLNRWLKIHKPDCIIDGNRVVIWWLLDLGFKIPSEILYVSLLNPGRARDVCHPGIIHHYDLQAEIAMERVISLIQLNRKGPADCPLRTLYPCSWSDAPSGRVSSGSRSVEQVPTKSG